MYELYELKKDNLSPYETHSIRRNIEIIKVNDKLIAKSILDKCRALYWNLITLGKARIYVVRDDYGSVIHSSYVIPRCLKFPFMCGGKS